MKAFVTILCFMLLSISYVEARDNNGGGRPRPSNDTHQDRDRNKNKHKHDKEKDRYKDDDDSDSLEVLGIISLATITTLALVYSFETGSSESGDSKRIIERAQDDAAIFIATNGQRRGIYLESALLLLRKELVKEPVSDIQLAEAILATPKVH